MSEITFGAYLRRNRIRAGLTQRQLGNIAGIDHTYISKMENDAAPPPAIATLDALADAVGVPVADMCAAAGRIDRDLTRQELEVYILALQHQSTCYRTALEQIAALTPGAELWQATEIARQALGEDGEE